MKLKRIGFSLFAILAFSVVLSACITPAYDRYEVQFPITDQSVERGEQAFVELKCIRCHTVRDYPLPSFSGAQPVQVELGGVILNAKTRADIATSIINPNLRLSERYLAQLSHEERRRIEASKLPESPMHDMTETMTVSQLIDLIAFLDSRYSTVAGYYHQPVW